MVNIVPILKNKKEFLELLLLADEQESMIDLYLERGEMYALYDGDLKAACVITDEGNGVYEIKKIRTQRISTNNADLPTRTAYPTFLLTTTIIPCMKMESF